MSYAEKRKHFSTPILSKIGVVELKNSTFNYWIAYRGLLYYGLFYENN